MNEGDTIEVPDSCKECGLRKAVLRDGFLYCLECGTRAADSQPVLDYEKEYDPSQGRLRHRKMPTKKSDNEKFSNMWSTWHAHNMILLGLVEELCSCKASGGNLPGVVLRLWSRWLRHNRVAFFSKSRSEPNLTIGFKNRDLELLYGFKKQHARKKNIQTKRVDSMTTGIYKATASKNALVKKYHEEFMDSQVTAVTMSQNIEDIKIDTKISSTIVLNAPAKKHYKKLLKDEKLQLHIEKGYCSSSCRCLKKKRFQYYHRKNVTALVNLYALLFLGLRINNDETQLGDMIRWCREGHLSFGNYKHFFPEDMMFKRTDRFRISAAKITHPTVLKTASVFARAFKLKGIKGPDVQTLVKRYLEELELPHELYGLILKIFVFCDKTPDYYPVVDKQMPNYEAIALSFIIVTLKMLFGLDGETENKNNLFAERVNEILNLNKDTKQRFASFASPDIKFEHRRLFVWNDWMEYIEYRKVCLGQCHYPTKIKLNPNDYDDPELFLHHQNKMRKFPVDGNLKDGVQSMIKSLLQRVEDRCDETEKDYPTFGCSLTPYASYTEELLNWQFANSPYSNVQYVRDILNENFSQYNVSFLVRPIPLRNLLKKKGCTLYTYDYSANPNIIIDKSLQNFTTCEFLQDVGIKRVGKLSRRNKVEVFNCNQDEWEKYLRIEKIETYPKSVEFKKDILESNNSYLMVNKQNRLREKMNYANVNSKRFKGNICIDLYQCMGCYWIKHYASLSKKFNQSTFDNELDANFPPSFAWLLRECASVAELSSLCLYEQLCIVEKKLIDKCNKKSMKKFTDILEND